MLTVALAGTNANPCVVIVMSHDTDAALGMAVEGGNVAALGAKVG